MPGYQGSRHIKHHSRFGSLSMMGKTDASSSSSNFSKSNKANLPSLKQLSDRLVPALHSSSSNGALNEITTNVPVAEPLASRLKLPPSAVERAKLSPPPGGKDDAKKGKENVTVKDELPMGVPVEAELDTVMEAPDAHGSDELATSEAPECHIKKASPAMDLPSPTPKEDSVSPDIKPKEQANGVHHDMRSGNAEQTPSNQPDQPNGKSVLANGKHDDELNGAHETTHKTQDAKPNGKHEDTKDATQTISNESSGDIGADTDKPRAYVPPTKRANGHHHKARASLGVGFPGGNAPETPARPKNDDSHKNDDPSKNGDDNVPEIVVQNSTPNNSPEKGTTIEATIAKVATIEKPKIQHVEKAVVQEPQVVTQNELPLAHTWTIYYDSLTFKADAAIVERTMRERKMSKWEAGLLNVGTFNTVQSFARHMNNIRLPSRLGKGANYHMFKDHIRPSWEDPANHNGGKWVLFVRQSKMTDDCWASLVMALVGEILDPENLVTGIVVSARAKCDRIQLWTRTKQDVNGINRVGQRILDALELDQRDMENISLDFQSNIGTEVLKGDFLKLGFGPPSRSVSVSVTPTGELRRNPLSRTPSSPGGTSPLLSPPSPRAPVRSISMVRTNSGGLANGAFSGPLGSRRTFNSPAEEK